MVHVWRPIEDLPEDLSSLSDGELGPLLVFWNDQRADLERNEVLNEFSQRLAREWAIETGQIEGVYNVDRGVTRTLIERGIRADLIPYTAGEKPSKLVAEIIGDHLEVLEGLFQFVKGDRPLSKSYIHELHVALLRHQDTTMVMDQFGKMFEMKLRKGRYKEQPNNPSHPDGTTHQYSPPEQVDSEMERLLELHHDHLNRGTPVEVEAAWMHHRFTQIHPYQDGNGRVARTLASLIFIKGGWFPVVITRDDRARYLDSLAAADEGDLRLLVFLFVDVQKRALFQATLAAADVQPIHTVEEAIASLKKVVSRPTPSLEPSVWLRAIASADRLMEVTEKRLHELEMELTKQVGEGSKKLRFATTSAGIEGLKPRKWFLPYEPNIRDYDQARSLVILAIGHSAITVEAHAIGSKFRGLFGIVVVFVSESKNVELASSQPFQVNYAEDYSNTEKRFRLWLEEALVKSLVMWRKSL